MFIKFWCISKFAVIKKYVCCRIASEVEKCWNKKAEALIAALICIPSNILTLRGGGVFKNNHENKYFISILPQQHKKSWSFSSLEERSRSICCVILMQNCRDSWSLLRPRDTAEHRSKYRQRWRLYMSENFSIGTKTPNKQTNKQTNNQTINQTNKQTNKQTFFFFKRESI